MESRNIQGGIVWREKIAYKGLSNAMFMRHISEGFIIKQTTTELLPLLLVIPSQVLDIHFIRTNFSLWYACSMLPSCVLSYL
jgi:hypothetical protein